MPLGFLAGLAEGFGNEAKSAREANAKKADIEWQRRKNFLDDVVNNRYGEPTEETLRLAMEGMAELSSPEGQPKRKSGFKSKITGEMDVILPKLIAAAQSGDNELYDEWQASGQGNPDDPQAGLNRSIQERGAPSAQQSVEGAAREQRGLQPPPGEGGQAAPGAPQGGGLPTAGSGAAMQRFARPMPPTASAHEGRLLRSVQDGAAAMGEEGPVRPMQGGFMRHPGEIAQTQAQHAAAARGTEALGEASAFSQVQEQYPDMPRADLYGVMSGNYSHPPAGASAGQYGMSSNTMWDGRDPSSAIEVRPDRYGYGVVDIHTGQPPPAGFVDMPNQSGGSGAQPTYVQSRSGQGYALVNRGDNSVTYGNFEGDFQAAPRSPWDAPPPTVEDPGLQFAGNAWGDAQKWESSQPWAGSMSGFYNPDDPEILEGRQGYIDSVNANLPPGVAPFESWEELRSRGQQDPSVPYQAPGAPAPAAPAAPGAAQPQLTPPPQSFAPGETGGMPDANQNAVPDAWEQQRAEGGTPLLDSMGGAQNEIVQQLIEEWITDRQGPEGGYEGGVDFMSRSGLSPQELRGAIEESPSLIEHLLSQIMLKIRGQ